MSSVALTVSMAVVTGLVLAAGRGERYGGPKALATTPAGISWLTRVAETLIDAGVPVTAVIPADLPEVAELLPPGARAVPAPTRSGGLSDSLKTGLDALDEEIDVIAALVVTVDAPALPPSAIDRVLGAEPITPSSLRRAVYRGRPGHPVLIGRDHWSRVRDAVQGDSGAGAYLADAGALEIECADLWPGEDIDTREG